MTKGKAIFLDTSIQIARKVHSPEIKKIIETQISNYHISTSSLVVKQEFKRRLIKEAHYLLKQIKFRKSYSKVLRHVHNLPQQQRRKMNICLDTLLTIDENDNEKDRTDRAICFFQDLLRNGLQDFNQSVDHVFEDSNCACGKKQIKPKSNDEYDFGTNKCSRTEGTCGISNFLNEHESNLNKISSHLKNIPASDVKGKKSKELQNIEEFVNSCISDSKKIEEKNPCYTVGDLLIALESSDIPTFYTLNGKESQHLCRILNQNLIVRRKNPEHDDITCLKNVENWPVF